MKRLKLGNNNDSKSLFDDFNKRLEIAERKLPAEETEREETDAEVEARFAKYREARAKERYGPAPGGTLTYGDVWDEIRDEEIDYYSGKSKPKHRRGSPEQRYQKRKKDWQWHESSWWMRRNTTTPPLTGYDGYGCSGEHGCIPSCRFYPETGRIEDEEVIAEWEEVRRKRDATTREEKRERRQRVHNYNLVYDDDTEEQRMQRQQQREKWQREHPDWRQWF